MVHARNWPVGLGLYGIPVLPETSFLVVGTQYNRFKLLVGNN